MDSVTRDQDAEVRRCGPGERLCNSRAGETLLTVEIQMSAMDSDDPMIHSIGDPLTVTHSTDPTETVSPKQQYHCRRLLDILPLVIGFVLSFGFSR